MVERMAVRVGLVPFVKMFIEQFVYWAYFSNSYYHAVLGALRAHVPPFVAQDYR